MSDIVCEMPDYNPPEKDILDLLRTCRTIAVVGLSPKESRDSNKVARYLIDAGYEVIPVNPGQKEILGKTCYRSLEDIPFPVDVADLFLNPSRVPPVVDQAIGIKVRAVWMQMGIVHNQAAQKARDAKIQVVMNRCIMRDHSRLMGT
jgi:uncharacterized protein